MSTKYPQGVITATPPFQSTTAQSFSGVWTLEQLGKNYFYYQQPVAKSLRFRSSATAYLNRTPSTGGNRTTWTWSGWFKIGQVNPADGAIFMALNNTSGAYAVNDWSGLFLRNSAVLDFIVGNGGSVSGRLTPTQVFRDFSAWYHLIVVFDSTNATSTERMRMYVNGSRITAFSTATYPAQNTNSYINSANNHFIANSWLSGATSNYQDGYFAEINFIDGQALDPSYFGQLSTITGVWAPKKYVGSYGGNGFYLPFTDATSTTTLGYDYSGNGNNWTTNNISLTSGVTYDSMWDSPTSYDNGVNGVGNYAVLNPLNGSVSATSDGNLTASKTTGVYSFGTVGMMASKYYWEVRINANGSQDLEIGVVQTIATINNTAGAYGWGTKLSRRWDNGVLTSTSIGTATVGDIVGIALDLTAATFTVYKNGTQLYQTTGVVAGTYFPAITAGGAGGSDSITINFGQRPFAYTPPTGFKALNTQNLPAVSIANGANHMAATLYTGNGATQSIINAYNSVSFKPDFVWAKARSNTQGHTLFDSVRGASKYLQSNSANAEGTFTAVPSFNSDGFTSTTDVSTNGYTYVGWQWKAGGTAVTNTAGSITSSVSANTTSGFSVVTYTGTGSNATVGHGLGVAPSMIIVKNRTTAATSWITYHSALLNTQALYLNTTDAALTSNLFWNNTSPTSSVFSVAAYNPTNQASTNIVAYCFAAIPGYSAFGSYTGNGSADGPFVYCGFRPRYVLTKRTDSTGNWQVEDTSRTPSNVVGQFLQPNLSNAEATATEYDILSNGFKLRSADADFNASGGTYIYAAFAENPFKYSLAR